MTTTSFALAVSPLLIPLVSPLLIGIIKKTKALLQGRIGASVFQPYRNLAKLFRKNEVMSEDASWISYAAPYIIFGLTIALAAGVPIVAPTSPLPLMSDVLVFAYTLAAGTFFLALLGMDQGGGFGGFGASREMMIAALAEGGLISALLAPALMSGTSTIALMPAILSGLYGPFILPLLLAAAAFAIALVAENARMPVDNPATHLELTMVHEAMILECSGKRLALVEWASMNKLLIFAAVGVNVFIPWGLAGTPTLPALLIALPVFLLKVAAVGIAIGFLESVMAKLRIFRVPDLLFTSFALGIIAILSITLGTAFNSML